jgi:hypothetical protein
MAHHGGEVVLISDDHVAGIGSIRERQRVA